MLLSQIPENDLNMNSKKPKLELESPERTGSPSTSEADHDKCTQGYNPLDLSLRRPRVLLENMSYLKPGTTFIFQDQQWVPVTVGKRKRKDTRTESKSLKDIIESLSQKKKKKPQRTSTEVRQHYNGLPSSSPIAEKRNKKTTSLSETYEEISSSESSLETQETSVCDSRLSEQGTPPHSNRLGSVSRELQKDESLVQAKSRLETQETSACDSRLSEQGTPPHSNILGSLSREVQKDENLVQAKSRVMQEKSWHLNSKTSPKQNRKRKNKQPPSRILKMSDFVSESISYESSKQLSHPQRNLFGSKKRISAEEQKSESVMEKLKKFRMSNNISEKPLIFKNMSSLSENPQESEEDELKQLEKLKNWCKNIKSASVNEEHRNQCTPEINVQRRYNSVKALEKRLKSVEAEKSHFQRLVSHLEGQRAEVQYAKVKAWTELERLKKEKESQANEIKRQKASIDNLRKEIQLKKHSSEEVERRLQQEKRRNNKMATNIEELTKINTRLQSQLKPGECLENEKNTGNSMANSESQNYKLQCECLQAELQENKTLVAELQNERQKLLNHNSDLLENLVMYQCDVNILKEKCASEEDSLRISQLEAEKEELSSCNRELSEKVRGFEKMLDDVKKAHTLLIEENAKIEVKNVEVCQNQSQPDLKQQEIDKLKKQVTDLKYTGDVIAKEREHLKSAILSLQSEKSSLIKKYGDTKINLEATLESNLINPRCENVQEKPVINFQLKAKMAEVVKIQQKLQIAKEIILEEKQKFEKEKQKFEKEKQQFEKEKQHFQEKIAENKLSEALHFKIQVAKMRALANLQLNPYSMTEEELKRLSNILIQPSNSCKVDVSTQVEISTYTHQKWTKKHASTPKPKPKWNLFKITDCAKTVQKPRELHPEDVDKTVLPSETDEVIAQNEAASTSKSEKSEDRSLANPQTLERQNEGPMGYRFDELESGNSLEEENAKLTHKIKAYELAFAEEHKKALKLFQDNQELVRGIWALKTNFVNLQKYLEVWQKCQQHEYARRSAVENSNEDSTESDVPVLPEKDKRFESDCGKLLQYYRELEVKYSHVCVEVARLRNELR